MMKFGSIDFLTIFVEVTACFLLTVYEAKVASTVIELHTLADAVLYVHLYATVIVTCGAGEWLVVLIYE